jgi:hypothetical protein
MRQLSPETGCFTVRYQADWQEQSNEIARYAAMIPITKKEIINALQFPLTRQFQTIK